MTVLTKIIKPSEHLQGDQPTAASPKGLADRTELAFTAVERSRTPMVIVDPTEVDQPIVLANQAFLALTGYSAEEVIGSNCRILQGRDTNPAVVLKVRCAIEAAEEIDIEVLNYRKDGSEFWNQLHLSPIHGDDGTLLYYFGSQLDVTERRKVERLEAAERMLLKEVDHRAMNALAIVGGIVRLTRAETTPLYAAAVQRRVQALAKAHTLLAELGWRDVPLHLLIHLHTDAFSERQIDLDGPEVLLAGHLVQPLALVLHELVINCATHGAFSRPSGSLAIRWACSQEPRKLEVEWKETGGPPPSLERPSGFGSSMMKGIINRQLGGRLRRSWETEGMRAHISLPLAA